MTRTRRSASPRAPTTTSASASTKPGSRHAYVAEMIGDEKFLVTDDFVGEPIPANADAAAAVDSSIEAKGGEFGDIFKRPVVYRVLKDEGIDWAAESAGGGRLFEVVSKYMNGYDGLAVRRARVWVWAGSSGSLGGGRDGGLRAAAVLSLGRPAEHNSNVTPSSPLPI